MSARHTAGPWSVYPHDPLVIVNSDGSSLGIASPGDPFIGFAEAKANALVWAAGAELLAANRAALICIGELSPTQARVEVAQMLQAAIVKATGSAA